MGRVYYESQRYTARQLIEFLLAHEQEEIHITDDRGTEHAEFGILLHGNTVVLCPGIDTAVNTINFDGE